MVSHNIEKLRNQQDTLKVLSRCKIKIRKAFLRNADKDLVEVICHCIYNLLNGNITLTESEKTNLSSYKVILRKLVEKSSLANKKKILVQKGGFLQFLIPAAITGISSIISSLISSNNNSVKQE